MKLILVINLYRQTGRSEAFKLLWFDKCKVMEICLYP